MRIRIVYHRTCTQNDTDFDNVMCEYHQNHAVHCVLGDILSSNAG